MDLSKDIVPGHSLGGIALGAPVDGVIAGLREQHGIAISEGVVSVDAGRIVIGYDANRMIYSVMCNASFEGNYRGRLWAGMTVRQVLENSRTQVAWGGAVVVDGIEGIGLPLPGGMDDFERLTDHLPPGHVFEHLSVFLV